MEYILLNTTIDIIHKSIYSTVNIFLRNSFYYNTSTKNKNNKSYHYLNFMNKKTLSCSQIFWQALFI